MENFEEIFEKNEDKIFEVVSDSLEKYLASEDMPLDDDWENGVEIAVKNIFENEDMEQLKEIISQ
jgi:hypothetical protein